MLPKSKKKKKILLFVLIIITMIPIVISHNMLTVSEYTYASKEVPAAFEGFKIAQVSDLHNSSYGTGNDELVKKLITINPDIILLTGDSIDKYNPDQQLTIDTVKKLLIIAPVYFVSGNHEMAVNPEFGKELAQLGVFNVDNSSASFGKDGDMITIAGLADPTALGNSSSAEIAATYAQQLKSLTSSSQFTILLAHRPEYASVYANNGADLSFSGHAHGGLIRIPFIGGIFAPHQGFFPKYDGGQYSFGNGDVIVSRGLTKKMPLRVLNSPEITVTTLAHE